MQPQCLSLPRFSASCESVCSQTATCSGILHHSISNVRPLQQLPGASLAFPTHIHPPAHTLQTHVTNTWTLAWQTWIKLSLFFEDIMFVFCISHVKLLCVWALCPGMRLINQITITEKYYNMPSYLCWSGFIQALLAPTLFTMTNFVPTTLWKNWWWGVFNTKKETAQI